MFCVKNVVRNVFCSQKRRKIFRFINTYCSYKNRSAEFMHLKNFFNNSKIFLFLCLIYHIRQIYSYIRFVCRDCSNLKVINFPEFCLFRHCRACHAGKFWIKPEQILEGNAGEGLGFVLNFYPLFCLNRLMQPVRPAAPFHKTSGKFINNYNFSVFNNIVGIFLIQFFCLKGLQKMMSILCMNIKKIFYAQKFLSSIYTVFRENYVFIFFINFIIYIFFQLRSYFSHYLIQLCRLFKTA